ncbi:MAG: hypothetical protein ABFD92_14345 [Planctomycetaceae bacterium]|nr:hypothetical protein [Planctomycetaceae bacterium]
MSLLSLINPRRLLDRSGHDLLVMGDERLAAEPPGRFANTGFALMLAAAVWGVGAAWLWGASWELFGGVGNSELAMPAAVTLAAIVAWPLRRALASLVETLFGRDATVRSLCGAALLILMFAAMFHLKADWSRSEWAMWQPIAGIRPQCKIYRVLILMPLWGCWSMLAVCQFCKKPPAEPDGKGGTSAPMATFARSCGPGATALWLAIALAASMGYYGYMGEGAQLTMAGASIAAAIVGTLILCRLGGGLTRRALLAGNALTQLVHLLTFLALQNIAIA